MTPGAHPRGEGSRVYAALLRAYPRRFRERFGTGMRYAFEEELRTARARGLHAVWSLWAGTTLSVFLHATASRLGRRSSWPHRGGGREGEGIVDAVLRELRHAMRRLSRHPLFTLSAALTLALGVGATTAIYSVVHGVVLEPLPYPDPDRLVLVGHQSPGNERGMPAAAYLYYRERAKTLSALAVYLESSAPIAGTGEPLELNLIESTPNLFSVLGVSPVLGRGFTEEDALEGAPPVAILSHGFWLRHHGGDPDILGKPALEGSPPIVVGVLPPGFRFPRPAATVVFGNPFEAPDIFLPLERFDRAGLWFGNYMYQALGRLAPDATPASALRELTGLMHEAAAAYPGGFTPTGLDEEGIRPRVAPVKDAIVGDVEQVLWILLAAVGFVLVIATGNVANLFMVRAESRRSELAVRRALGAGGASLARAFLAEAGLLALVGGGVGTGVAAVGIHVLVRSAGVDIPRLEQVGMSTPVLAFALVITGLAAVAFGLAPVLRAVRIDPGGVLGEQSRGGTAGRNRRRMRDLLVVSQVGLATVLLVGSGLLLRTFQSLSRVDPGFVGAHTATFRLSLSGSLLRAAGHAEARQDVARTRYMMELSQRLESLEGVELATFSADLPLDGSEYRDYVAVEGALPEDLESATTALRVFVGPEYLTAIGAHIVRGRDLQRLDFADEPRVAVVNRAFVRQRWTEGGDPVGRRIAQYFTDIDPEADIWYTIVGVVDDIHEGSLMTAPEPTVYLPTIFRPDGGFAMWVSNLVAVVRCAGDPDATLPVLLAETRSFAPEVPVSAVETLDALTARSFRQVSFAMVLLVTAACVAVVLGLVGVYGTVAYLVGQRTREFGLRFALGATAGDVLLAVLREGGVLGALGIGVGLLGSLAAGGVLSSLLYGVSARDPSVYGGVTLALFTLVIVASLAPGARAAVVDPAVAIRIE